MTPADFANRLQWSPKSRFPNGGGSFLVPASGFVQSGNSTRNPGLVGGNDVRGLHAYT